MKKKNKKIRENMISKYDISPIGLRLARPTAHDHDTINKSVIILLDILNKLGLKYLVKLIVFYNNCVITKAGDHVHVRIMSVMFKNMQTMYNEASTIKYIDYDKSLIVSL